MALADLCVNTVNVRKAAYANVRGKREPSYTDTVWQASAQPMTATEADEWGIENANTAYLIFFTADPGVNKGDLVVVGSKTLSVAGPASDQAGRGRVFAVAASL